MLQNLREIMGLTIEQVADELSISAEQVAQAEKVNDKAYSYKFFYIFPINRGILRHPDADPFLPSYDQTSPGKRLESWMLENKISASTVAERLNIQLIDVFEFINHPKIITKARGEEIQRKLGINRKWLMYGDGRNKGKPVHIDSESNNQIENKNKTILEMMSSDFEKFPDDRIISKSDIRRERKAWGYKVREARKNANLSLRELAEYLCLSASRIGQMECGIITEKQAMKVLMSISDYSRKKEAFMLQEQSETDKKEMTLKAEVYDVIKSDSENERKNMGQQIRNARKNANLTIKEMAKILCLSTGRISQIECGMISNKQAESILRSISEYSKNKNITVEPSAKRTKETTGFSKDDPPTNIQWGEKIKKERIKVGLSQAILGSKLGKSQATISMMEKGNVTEETARWILEVIEKNRIV